MPRKEIPSTVASKVASSTNVDTAEITAFHSSEPDVFAEKTKSDFLVLDENEGKETMPTIEIECEKCGNKEAFWWMLQTRSADEPTTQFYRCTKCEYTWRNYA